jgi:hypothetical protein
MNKYPQRQITGKVDLYTGSTISNTFLPTGDLQEFTVERTGEKGKFFGFGVCQKLTVKVRDPYASYDSAFVKGKAIITSFKASNQEITTSSWKRVCPTFYIKDAVRDEKTNVYTITSYDALDSATSHLWSELVLSTPYTITSVVGQITSVLGLSGYESLPSGFTTTYNEGANFSGEETLRQVLNAIAEATQTIYYVNHNNKLVFKRLDVSGSTVMSIDKKDYFELTTALPVTLNNIVSVTDLGDNVGTISGVVQYVRDNAFWTNRNDLGTLLSTANSRIAGLTIVPYNVKWRGNFLSELGDKISVENKNGDDSITYILGDSFTYNGGFSQTMGWEYNPDTDKTTASNPVTIGEKLNQTFARVDKVNRKVTIHASEIADAKESISELEVNTQSIKASVSSVEQKVNGLPEQIEGAVDQANSRIDTIARDVAMKLDKTGVEITIDEKLENGVDKVVTAGKKYKFDDDGLNVSSSQSNISTRILDDGMRIYKNSQEVLIADNHGVKAQDLHAYTFLIIGENSRLEDRGNRTGCFWIGKVEV